MSWYADGISSYAQTQIDPSITRAHYIQKASFYLRPVVIDTQQKLEQQVITQVRHGKIFVAIRAARLVVVVFFFPPFFIAYAVPRWVFQKTQPLVFKWSRDFNSFFRRSYLRISAWNGDVFAIAANRLKSLMRSKGKKKPLREGDNLFQALAKDVLRRVDKYTVILKILLTSLRKVSQQISSKFSATQNSIQTFFNQQFNRLKAPFVQIVQQMTRIQERIKQHSETLRLKVSKNINKVQEKIKEIQNIIIQNVEKFLKPLLNLPQAIQASVAQILNPTITVLQAGVINPIKAIAAAAMAPINAIKHTTTVVMHWVRERSLEGINFFLQLKNNLISKVDRAMEKSVQRLQPLQKVLAHQLTKTTQHVQKVLQPFGKKIYKIFDGSFQFTKKHFNQWKEKAKKALLVAHLWIVDQARQLPSRIFQLLKRLKVWLYKTIKKLIWGMRVAYTWAKVLIMESIKTVWFD